MSVRAHRSVLVLHVYVVRGDEIGGRAEAKLERYYKTSAKDMRLINNAANNKQGDSIPS